MMSNYDIATTKEEWHELRSKGLGGSDIGTILGLNPFKTTFQLWLEKTGQVELEDISDKIHIQIGNELEDLVARIFEQETGLKVQKDNKTHYHKDYPYLLANIDRKIVGEKALLECKTTSAFSKKQWEDDEVPASYLMQVQHYLNVLDYDYAYIAVIIGNNDFVYKKIERDDELISMYTDIATKFWLENVQKGIEPDIDYTDKQAINYLTSQIDENTSVEASEKEINAMVDALYFKEQTSTMKSYKDEAEAKVKKMMADLNATEITSEMYSAKLSKYNRTTFDTKQFKKDYPDLHKQYSKVSESTRLTIKEN